MEQTNINLILDKTKELLDQLQVSAKINITLDEQTDYYHIQLETETPGLLIGYRGETLSSFQLILGLLINQGKEEWKKIIVNVGDYRQRREETVIQLAQNAAQRVKFSGEPYYFEGLTPAERRIVHMTLKENSEINTYSEGEGRHRQLIVAPN